MVLDAARDRALLLASGLEPGQVGGRPGRKRAPPCQFRLLGLQAPLRRLEPRLILVPIRRHEADYMAFYNGIAIVGDKEAGALTEFGLDRDDRQGGLLDRRLGIEPLGKQCGQVPSWGNRPGGRGHCGARSVK